MEQRAADTAGLAGRGGMRTKLEAAHLTMSAGVIMVIAHGREPNVIRRIIAGEEIGTIFMPKLAKMRSRKRWIAYAAVPMGRLIVDQGAAKALLEEGKSLLPVGVIAVEGAFEAGDMVAVHVRDGEATREIARGLTNYDSDDLKRIQGCRSKDILKRLGHRDFDEAIHRDNLVVL
jgi:glutamate 5-kinase